MSKINLKATKRQKEVLKFILKGFSNKEISIILEISEKRVYDLVKELLRINNFSTVNKLMFAFYKEKMIAYQKEIYTLSEKVVEYKDEIQKIKADTKSKIYNRLITSWGYCERNL